MDFLKDFDLTRLLSLFEYDPKSPLIFSSGLFLWLFAGFIGFYVALRRRDTARLLFVVLFSYYFYYKSSGTYFFLLAVVSLSDFLIGRTLERLERKAVRMMLAWLSLFINLGLLAYFKYTDFLGQTIANLFQDGHFEPLNIFLPVGISFFTFQSLSYTIDIYRRQIKALSRPLDYFFYVSFFPQLVAGPIVRARDFIPQIRKPLYVSREMFSRAALLIAAGLFKKAVISDYISVNFVDRVFDQPTLYGGLENLMAVYGYALQIYCDFSGYSDMAIGIALLLGFKFPTNFLSPYKAVSVTDFWRRWHISLSTWLRDYVYITLGGNRKGQLRRYVNLVLTMLIGGLWHGASWTFVLWGGAHGVALAVHKLWMGLAGQGKNAPPLPWWRRLTGVMFTFHFVCLCWVFFRADSLNSGLQMLECIFTSSDITLLPQLISGYPVVMALFFIGYFVHFVPDKVEQRTCNIIARAPLLLSSLIIIAAAYAAIQAKGSDVQPFIYFQF